MIKDVARRAGFNCSIQRIMVNDPDAGFDELGQVCSEAGAMLLGADNVTANLTGGTTLMSIMLRELVRTAGRLSRPCRRLALIDRRSSAEQESVPWVQSDCHWLDGPQAETAGR